MLKITNQTFFIVVIAASILMIYLLAPILTPFLLGALLAYLTNPLVKRLDHKHVPHLLSVVSIFLFIFGVFVILLLMLVPLIQEQVTAFIEGLPQIISWLHDNVISWLTQYINLGTLKASLSTKTALIFATILQSGYTLIDFIVTLVLTPVVTFYFLRDWDSIVKVIKDSLPKTSKPTILKFTHECDEVLGAFFRGQLLVMLSLCLIYGIGLSVIGLKVGIVIGVIGGLLSIVPYLGSIFVIVAASITSVVQFGDWKPLLWVLAVYLIGQIIEAYILTPYFVGNRIGLHPVAVIFAIMAGGALFGFFGILLALPAAAVIMVLLRFVKQRVQMG